MRCKKLSLESGNRTQAQTQDFTDTSFLRLTRGRFGIDSGDRFRIDSEPIRDQFVIDSRLIRDRFRVVAESIQCTSGLISGSIRDRFGVDLKLIQV